MSIVCPNYQSQDWKNLMQHTGSEVESHRVFEAHGNYLPVIPTIGQLKLDLGFKARGISSLMKSKMLIRLKNYNEKHNSSHRIEFKAESQTSDSAALFANFMPKYEVIYTNNNLKTLKKVSSDVSIETIVSPSDLITNEANEFVVDGNVYASYEDAINSVYFQKSNKSEPSKESELDLYLKQLLSNYRITINQIDNFKEKYGFDGVAMADIANKVIDVAKSRADIITLPEEAAHFIVEMISPENSLYKAIYKDIVNTQEYQDVVSEYSDLYKGNEEMLRKEAIGKVLAKYFIKNYGNKVNLNSKTLSLFERLMNFIKSFWKKIDNSGLSNELDAVLNKLSIDILNQDIELDESRLGRNQKMYAQLSNLKKELENSIEKLGHRAASLERRALSASDENLAETLRTGAQFIKDKLDANQIELGVASFLEHININELDFLVESMDSFIADPNSINYGSDTLVQMIKTVQLYEGLVSDLNKALMTGGNYAMYEKFKSTISETNKKISDLKSFTDVVYKERVRAIINSLMDEGSKYDVDSLLNSTIGDIGYLARLFGPLHAANDEVLRMVYKMVMDVHQDSYRDALRDGQDLKTAQFAMEKAGYKDISVFHEKDDSGKATGYVLAKHKWGEYNVAKENAKFAIAKEFGVNDYGEINSDELSEADSKKLRRLWYELFHKKYSIKEVNDSGDMAWVPSPPLNSEYDRLMSIPSIKNYYDVMMRIHTDSKNLLPKKYRENPRYAFLLPQIRKDIMQTIKDSDDSLMSNIGSRIKESFKITEDDTEFGELSKDVIKDINGKAIKLIPMHFVSPIKDASSLSNDMTSMYAAFSEMSRNFRSLSERSDDMFLIMKAMSERLVTVGKDIKIGAETNTYQALTDFMDMFFYGNEKERSEVTFLGKKYDLTKFGDKTVNFVRQNNLFMSLFTAISGYTKASIDSKIEDIIGLYTTQESKIFAEKEFDSNIASLLANINNRDKTNKMELVFEYNGVFKELRESFQRMDIDNRLLRTTWNDIVYSSYELFDTRVKGKLTLAIYDNYRLVDNKFITRAEFLRKYKDRNWSDYKDKTLYNAYEASGNKLVVKPEFRRFVTRELENKVMGTIKHRSVTIDGMLNKLDKAPINRNLFGRMLMLHRGWLVSGVTERFKASGINYITSEFEEGYYRTMWKALGKMIKTEGGLRQKLAMWNALEEYEKRNARRMLADIAFSVALYSVYLLLNSIADDDDEDTWYIQAMAFQSTRVLMEQMAFQNPTEVLNILNSPTAMTSTLESMKDMTKALVDWNEIEAGPYKGMYKAEKILIKNSLLKNLYEMQYPKYKNKFLKTQVL